MYNQQVFFIIIKDVPTRNNDSYLSKLIFKTKFQDHRFYDEAIGMTLDKFSFIDENETIIYIYSKSKILLLKIYYMNQTEEMWRIYLERAQEFSNSLHDSIFYFNKASSLTNSEKQFQNRVKIAEGLNYL
jgi:hypothetical protein